MRTCERIDPVASMPRQSGVGIAVFFFGSSLQVATGRIVPVTTRLGYRGFYEYRAALPRTSYNWTGTINQERGMRDWPYSNRAAVMARRALSRA